MKNEIYEFNKEDLILRDFLATDRTMLANERTFLAYLRTFLSLIVTGCTMIKISENTILTCTGYILITLGTLIGIHGIKTFLKISKNLRNIKYISDKYEIKK